MYSVMLEDMYLKSKQRKDGKQSLSIKAPQLIVDLISIEYPARITKKEVLSKYEVYLSNKDKHEVIEDMTLVKCNLVGVKLMNDLDFLLGLKDFFLRHYPHDIVIATERLIKSLDNDYQLNLDLEKEKKQKKIHKHFKYIYNKLMQKYSDNVNHTLHIVYLLHSAYQAVLDNDAIYISKQTYRTVELFLRSTCNTVDKYIEYDIAIESVLIQLDIFEKALRFLVL